MVRLQDLAEEVVDGLGLTPDDPLVRCEVDIAARAGGARRPRAPLPRAGQPRAQCRAGDPHAWPAGRAAITAREVGGPPARRSRSASPIRGPGMPAQRARAPVRAVPRRHAARGHRPRPGDRAGTRARQRRRAAALDQQHNRHRVPHRPARPPPSPQPDQARMGCPGAAPDRMRGGSGANPRRLDPTSREALAANVLRRIDAAKNQSLPCR